MATDVTMPRLSDSMEEGTVIQWLVEQGGEVKRGEPLVEIETDKANMTYDADTDGTLIEILAGEGDTLAIGEPIARVGEAGEEPSSDGASAEEPAGGKAAAEGAAAEAGRGEADAEAAEDASGDAGSGDSGSKVEPDEARTPVAEHEGPGEREGSTERETRGAERTGDGRMKASPVARRVAQEMGVELARVEGSGPGGRIVKADVEAAADGAAAEEREREAPVGEAPPAEERAAEAPSVQAPERPEAPGVPEPVAAGEAGAKGEVKVQELTRLQQTVSRRMAESKATAPDFQLTLDVDMGACIELRARLKEIAEPAPSFNDMVVKACAGALREFPRVNAAYRDGRFELYSRVNVGVAVAARDALVVPTLFDADRKSLGEIARDARRLIERVRDAEITPPELSGGTFTVSNLGMYGIERFSGVINPPQAALLAVGAVQKKAAVDDAGRIVARDLMTLTLVCDHRILYGADGARFLARVRELLEQPLALAL